MFLSHNIVFNGKNRAKVMYFMKLAILIFGCPGDMHITNFTRMPLYMDISSFERNLLHYKILLCQNLPEAGKEI